MEEYVGRRLTSTELHQKSRVTPGPKNELDCTLGKDNNSVLFSRQRASSRHRVAQTLIAPTPMIPAATSSNSHAPCHEVKWHEKCLKQSQGDDVSGRIMRSNNEPVGRRYSPSGGMIVNNVGELAEDQREERMRGFPGKFPCATHEGRIRVSMRRSENSSLPISLPPDLLRDRATAPAESAFPASLAF